MAKRLKLTDREKVSTSFIHSCKAFVAKDIDIAFLWAIRVLDQAHTNDLYLTDPERAYITEVLKRKQRKNKKN